MIRLDGVRFRYRTGDFRLEVDELTIAAGDRVALTGPSGSGKTTLLRLVAGISLPESGRVVVGDVEVSGLGDAARRWFRSSTIGLVFQEFELLDYLSVLDNVLLPYRISGALRLDPSVRERAAAVVERVGLADKLRRSTRRLSHGERQRVAVCRALLPEPRLLLADEPTGNLDPANRDRVLEILLGDAAERDATLVTVTHDHDLLDRFERTLDVRDWGRS